MDSFLKDALSAIILASWVFPVLYLALALTFSGLAALVRRVRGNRDTRPPAPRGRARREQPATPVTMPVRIVAAPAARAHSPASALASLATARHASPVPARPRMRPRVATRWKSSERVTASAG